MNATQRSVPLKKGLISDKAARNEIVAGGFA
jgi:hypothetical protein